MKLPLTVTLNAQDIQAYYSAGILPLSCIAALARALDAAHPYPHGVTYAEWVLEVGAEVKSDQCGLCGQQLNADAHCPRCSRPKKRRATPAPVGGLGLALGVGEGEDNDP